MRILVIGLGSMGKRRLRCLQALGETELAGADPRADRRAEARDLGASVYPDAAAACEAFDPEALVISVPPDVHHVYMREAAGRGLPFFVEASVVDTDLDAIRAAVDRAGIVAAPSATWWFHPAVRAIDRTVRDGRLGALSNVIAHTGHYLPEWHTYEPVSDFYVSRPETGGGREMVPFELTWLTRVFGLPRRVGALVRKTIDIPGAPEIDDTYDCLLDWDGFVGVLVVDVVSRTATRRVLVNGDQGQLVWDWDADAVRVYDPRAAAWEEVSYEVGAAAPGYAQNIGERMYQDELRAFLDAVRGGPAFPNTLADDQRILGLLYALEASQREGRFVTV